MCEAFALQHGLKSTPIETGCDFAINTDNLQRVAEAYADGIMEYFAKPTMEIVGDIRVSSGNEPEQVVSNGGTVTINHQCDLRIFAKIENLLPCERDVKFRAVLYKSDEVWNVIDDDANNSENGHFPGFTNTHNTTNEIPFCSKCSQLFEFYKPGIFSEPNTGEYGNGEYRIKIERVIDPENIPDYGLPIQLNGTENEIVGEIIPSELCSQPCGIRLEPQMGTKEQYFKDIVNIFVYREDNCVDVNGRVFHIENEISNTVDDAPVDILFSNNNGATYDYLIVSGFTGSQYDWIIPENQDLITNQGKIKIQLHVNQDIVDVSESFAILPFSTNPTSSQFTLTNFNGPPSNGDTRYYGNQIYTIAWNSSIAPQGLVTIELSTNCGASFDQTIATNILSDVGQYQWQIPNNINTADAMIRITFRSIPPASFREEIDMSHECFVIEPQQINAFAPTQTPKKCPSEGYTITFPYYVNKGFQPGTEFIVELSDENGSFTNAFELCRLAGTGTGSITCDAPTHIINSGTYKFRIRSTAVSFYPEVTSLTQNIEFFPAPSIEIGYTGIVQGDGV